MPKLSPITIKFTSEGSNPLADASISLIPQDQSMSKWLVGGTTDAQGVCVIRTLGRYNGAPIGKYKIIVQKTILEGGDNTVEVSDQAGSGSKGGAKSFHLVDKKFRNLNTTPLEIEVKEKDNAEATFDTEKPVREAIVLSAG
jgi:hypothetical protein